MSRFFAAALLTFGIISVFSTGVAEENDTKSQKMKMEAMSPDHKHSETTEASHSHDHGDSQKHDHSDQEASLEKSGDNTLIVKVKGMVCAFCAQGIENNFKKRKEVKATKVNLDTMEVTVTTKKDQSLSKKVIKKIITDAGFQFVGFK